MAAPQTSYADFEALYGQAVGAEAFAEALPHAEAVVRDLTWPNEPEGEAQEGAWRRAVCAALLADARGGGTHGVPVGGFTIGKFSVSGGSGTGSDALAGISGAARRELVGSGLLCLAVGPLC